jgi:hypothetical protein
MLILSFSILLIIIAAIASNLDGRNNAFTLVSGGITLFLLASFRHHSMGTDTMSYIVDFLSLKDFSWEDEVFEKGYSLFKLSVYTFTNNPNLYLVANSMVFLTSIFIFLHRYSKEALLSIFIFISLGYYQFSFSGLRQALAIAIVLFSYASIRDRKLFQFLFIVVIAAQFHNTALIFIIAYPIANLKIGLWHFVTIIFFLAIVILFGDSFLVTLLNMITIDFFSNRFSAYYGDTSSVSLSLFAILFLIWFFCLIIHKIYDFDGQLTIFLNLVFIGLLFQSLTPLLGEFFRLSMYFNIFSIALLPNSILLIRSLFIRGLAYVIVCISFILYYLLFGIYNFGIFKFYWE